MLECSGARDHRLAASCVARDLAQSRAQSRTWLAASLLRAMPLPPAAGLALGLCGLAAIVEETVGVAPVVVCALAGACALLLAIAARAALRGGRALRDELAAPRVAFAYAVYEMALVLALGRATAGAAPALYACAALQLGLLGAFLAACAAAGAAPEPYWAPPCVGSGATCIAGAAALGPRHGLVLASWALACAGALLLAPAATLRVARDDAVANDATAFILQAPFSMPGLAFAATPRGRRPRARPSTPRRARAPAPRRRVPRRRRRPRAAWRRRRGRAWRTAPGG